MLQKFSIYLTFRPIYRILCTLFYILNIHSQHLTSVCVCFRVCNTHMLCYYSGRIKCIYDTYRIRCYCFCVRMAPNNTTGTHFCCQCFVIFFFFYRLLLFILWKVHIYLYWFLLNLINIS